MLVRTAQSSSEARVLAASAGQPREFFSHFSIFDHKVCEEAILVAAQPQSRHGGAKSGCQKQIPLFVQGVLNAALLASR